MIEHLTEMELAKLKNTKSEQEWNDCCDEVKTARGGQYPPDRYARVVVSGIAYDVQQNWK